MRALAALAAVFTLALPAATEAASYYLNRYEDGEVTRYGNPDWHSDVLYTSPISVMPFRTVTHALHPYYRSTYYTRRAPRVRITRPEFYQYLGDLYFNGELGVTGSVFDPAHEVPQSLRCPNYSVRRANYRMPRAFEGCNS